MTKYPVRRFGADRRSAKPVAGTCRDLRLKDANCINNAGAICIAGTPITATQTGSIVTVSCDCNMTYTMEMCALFAWQDALASFVDMHPSPSKYTVSVLEPLKYVPEPFTSKRVPREKCHKRKRSDSESSTDSSTDED